MSEHYGPFLLYISIINVILSPAAVFGNALVLTAILKNSSLRTPSYILLAALAFTDFGTGLISQPLYVINVIAFSKVGKDFNTFNRSSSPRTYLASRMIGSGIGSYFGTLTMLIITVMSIERWLHMSRHVMSIERWLHMSRRSLVTMRRTYIAIAVLLLLPIPFAVCRVLNNPFNIAVNVASSTLLIFCLVITPVAYFKVFQIIRAHQQQIHSSELFQNAAQPAMHMAKYKKSVFTILYILAIFLICYLPIAISFGLIPVLNYEKETVPLLNFSFLLAFMSSSLNPVLYLWRMKDIRNEVARLIKAVLCRQNENWRDSCQNCYGKDFSLKKYSLSHYILQVLTEQYTAIVSGWNVYISLAQLISSLALVAISVIRGYR